MRAMSLIRDRAYFLSSKNGETTQEKEKSVWAEKLESSHELTMRDNILRSICPSVYGMYPVKLAIALAICSGVSDISENRHDRQYHRNHSHVLLVGDPGVAKSRLLQAAASIAPKAVQATGMGSTAAGLTAAAVKVGQHVL